MRQTIKLALLCMALCTTALFMQCEKADEPVNTAAATTTSAENLIPFNEVLATLQNDEIKQTLLGLQAKTSQKSGDTGFGDLKYFQKFEYTKLTNYCLNVSDYTDDSPYYLQFIIEIDKQTGVEKSGFLKFVPQTKTSQPVLNVNTFTGQLQALNNSQQLQGGALFTVGRVTGNILGTTTCKTTVVMISHPCTNGDEHEFGQSCGSGFVNDAYLSFQFFTDCWTTFPTYGTGGGSSGPGGGGAPSHAQQFLNSLSQQQRDFLNHPNNTNIKSSVLDYIKTYGASQERVKQMIDEMIGTGLQFNINYSVVSPFNIDMKAVEGNTAEEIKFRKVYDKLLFSPKFREIFVNMFGVTDFINTKFKIENIPQNTSGQTLNGYCRLTTYNTGKLHNDIVINRNLLLTASDEKIALVIIHECLHAFLNIKLNHPSIGASINNINNMNLASAINLCYNGFNGNQTQHDFFADHLTPTITEILMDLKNTLLTPQQRNSVENPINGAAFLYVPTNSIPRTASATQIPWNWNDYFRHLSFEGLQNCSVFLNYYPQNSIEDYHRVNYINAGRVVILP